LFSDAVPTCHRLLDIAHWAGLNTPALFVSSAIVRKQKAEPNDSAFVLSALQHTLSNSGRTPNNIIEFLEVLFNRVKIRLLD
jgi:hypothetical protein